METEIYYKAIGLMDSEFEVLDGMTKDDLWDYLSGQYHDITKEQSDYLWEYFWAE